ncbi:unnamed protein product, partial [Amoebophrya sp. A120]|eukprot:GSA120T00016993001.1
MEAEREAADSLKRARPERAPPFRIDDTLAAAKVRASIRRPVGLVSYALAWIFFVWGWCAPRLVWLSCSLFCVGGRGGRGCALSGISIPPPPQSAPHSLVTKKRSYVLLVLGPARLHRRKMLPPLQGSKYAGPWGNVCG